MDLSMAGLRAVEALALILWGGVLLAYLRLRFQPSIRGRDLATAFGLGGCGAVLLVLLAPLFLELGGDVRSPVLRVAFESVVMAGLVEEGVKAFILLGLVLPAVGPSRPTDAVALAGGVALGFGVMETLLHSSFGNPAAIATVAGRMLLSVPVHLLCGLLIGMGAVASRYRPGARRLPMIAAVLSATIVHGTFNFLVLSVAVSPALLPSPVGPLSGAPLAMVTLHLVAGTVAWTGARRAAGRPRPPRRLLVGGCLTLAGSAALLVGAAAVLLLLLAVQGEGLPTEEQVGTQLLLAQAGGIWSVLGFAFLADGVRMVRRSAVAAAVP